jgi:hypothetical protein
MEGCGEVKLTPDGEVKLTAEERAYLERLAAGPGAGLEAAINRRLAKKLGCKPEEVDLMLSTGDKEPVQ